MSGSATIFTLKERATFDVVTKHMTLNAADALVSIRTVLNSVICFVTLPAFYFCHWTLGCDVIGLLAVFARVLWTMVHQVISAT